MCAKTVLRSDGTLQILSARQAQTVWGDAAKEVEGAVDEIAPNQRRVWCLCIWRSLLLQKCWAFFKWLDGSC